MAEFEDPFAYGSGEKLQGISFGHTPPESGFTLKLDGPAKKVRGIDFETRQPATWKNSGDPKYSAVVEGEVTAVFGGMQNVQVGDRRSFWSDIPSAAFRAIGKAQAKAGVKLDKGGLLSVKTLGLVPNPKGGLPFRDFAANYEVPVSSDPWSDDEPPF